MQPFGCISAELQLNTTGRGLRADRPAASSGCGNCRPGWHP